MTRSPSGSRKNGRLEIAIDATAASRRVAIEAIEFLSRSAGLTERECRDLTGALASGLRLLARGNGGPLHCDVTNHPGEIRVRSWSGAARPRRIPAGEAEALLRALRRRVVRADWTRGAGEGPREGRSPRLVLVQKGQPANGQDRDKPMP